MFLPVLRARRAALSLAVFCLGAAALHAQAERSPDATLVTGVLLDAATEERVGFANVAAYTTSDSLVAGATTDFDGAFALADLPYGTYRVEMSFIGYATVEEAVTLSADTREADLGRIALAVGGQELTEAVVTADRAVMELGLDRKVFNVENNIAAAGGSATDLLRNLPSVTVDLDGNVSLRGSGNVRFLINGRPSGLTAGDPATFLQSLSAANIERIEVITNPGAGFDPEGTAGLINIVLKQQRREGLNGSVTLNVGTRDKYDGNVNVNYRQGKFNHFAGVGGRFDERGVSGYRQQRGTTGAGVPFARDNTFGGYRQNTGITLRGGTEYALNATGTLQLQGTCQYGDGQSYNDRNTRFLGGADRTLDSTSLRSEREPEVEREYEVRADYNQTLPGEGHRLGGSLQYGYSGELETENYDEYIRSPADDLLRRLRQNAPVDEVRRNYLGQLDYERRFGESIAFTAGWRSTLERLRTDAVFNDYNGASDAFQKVDSLSNLFDYREDVHALYATLGAEVERWKLSGGLRAEQAFTTSAVVEPLPQAQPFDNNYFKVYPSVYVGYELTDAATAQVSYSRRINRPRSRELNPFVDRGDRFNLRSGNPFLLPELINSYEANVQWRIGDATLTTGAYFRQKSDLITRVTETLEGGVSLSTRANLAQGQDYGVEVITTYRPLETLDFTFSGNAYRTKIVGQLAEGAIDVDGYLFDARLSANAKLPWKIEGQATYFYRSPGVTAQGEIRAIQNLDVGLRRDVLGGRGAVTLRVSDVFNTQRYRFTNDVRGLYTATEYKRESRIAYLGFQYRFGIDADERPREERRGRGDGGGGGGGDDF